MTAEPSHDDGTRSDMSLQNPKASSAEDGCDVSVSSSNYTQQKRFSFYNAQDYQVKIQTPQQQQQQQQTPPPPSNPSRFHFYNADEIAKKERSEQQQQQQQQQQQSSCQENSSHHHKKQQSSDLDSTEILRSLQEHEQQRLEILGVSSSSSTTTTSASAAAAAPTSTATATVPTSAAAAAAATKTLVATSTSSVLEPQANRYYQQQQQTPRATASNNNTNTNNIYEVAIKEALELLRRHRNSAATTAVVPSLSTAPNTPHNTNYSSAQALPSPLASDVVIGGGVGRRYSATKQQTIKTQQQQQQQQHANNATGTPASSSESSRALHGVLVQASTTTTTRESSSPDEILKARASWEAPSSQQQQQQQQQTTSSMMQHHSILSPPPVTPSHDKVAAVAAAATTSASSSSSIVLGEAYQAEIEARRKQRQERMARYASRLAELKQGTTTTTTTTSPTGSMTAIGSLSSSSSSKHATAAQTWNATTARRGSSNTSSSTNGNNKSNTASSSHTLWQPKQQQQRKEEVEDEDVQRGVERVLLAILERANSRGRFSSGDGGSGGSRGYGEEKKSADLTLLQSRSMSSSSTDDYNIMSDDGASKSNSNSNKDDDALLRAISELLQQSSSMQTGSMDTASDGLFADDDDDDDEHLDNNTNNKDNEQQQHLQQDTTVQTAMKPQQQQQQQHTGDAETTVTQDSQTLAIRSVGSDPEAHQELDRMVERIFNEPAEDILEDILNSKEDENNRGGGDDDQHVVNDTIEEDQAVEVVVEPTGVVGKESRTDHRASDESEAYSQESEEGSEDEYTVEEEEEDVSLGEGETGDEEDDSLDEGEIGEESYDDEDDGGGDESENDSQHRKRGVLGPLSMLAGGTTGVVLEGSSSGESEKQPSIFEAALNLVTGGDTNSRSNDKYAARPHESDDDDDDSDSDSSSSSASANSQGSVQELTRTLCAHLFPRGHGDHAELQSRIPKWDESDGDEPGYRIIRLNSHQLETVEQEFEHVLKIWKKNASIDESFERDLKEAEDLLEQEERRAKASEPDAAPASNDLVPPEAGPNDIECLEHFPGVKPAGQGEMGDLEYFHLPIIFKSHVTGFEPTKDIRLEPGNIIAGQYLVEGELGSAAFSTAYRCIDLNSEGGEGPDGHDEVCLKVIKNTKDFFDQSLDEIKILELLRQTGKCHENHILEMKTFFYHREHLMIVTELLRQNLFEFGKFIIDNEEEPYFTIARLSFVTRQVLIALKFIHNIGLVHSDVKPENILLSSYSRAQIKLIDFGSSCYLTDRQSSYIQSRSYRAPEVVLGLPYDGRIDIWSLGCVVAEMYTGEVTFQNDSVVSMLSRIEAICGKFPDHMIEQGRQSAAFFTRCGLLFEKVSRKKDDSYHDDSSDEDKNVPSRSTRSYDIFQPKRTTLAARLGFNKNLMEKYDANQSLSHEQKRQAVFVDFVRTLLTIDPGKRPSAEEALKHPWMEYAAALTEEDIKYPSG